MPPNQHFLKAVVAAIAIVFALAAPAQCAGLLLYETNATDIGTASSGRAALAEDASIAGSNPAGMTMLDRTQLMGSPGALLPFSNFDLAPQTSTPGGGGGNSGVFTPTGGFFFVYRPSEKLRLGVAADSDFGLSADFGKSWAGRYYVTSESIITSKVNPSIAYMVTQWLSVGAGFSFSVARLGFQSKINNAAPNTPDGSLSFESWDEAFGGNVGILLHPIKKLRVGLTYQSPVDYKFGFRPRVTGLGPGLTRIRDRFGGAKFNIPMEVPQQVTLSGVYQVTSIWSLMGSVGWQNWSAFSEFPIGVSGVNQRTLDVNLHFSDTCQVAIGQQLQLGRRWLWSAGFAYDSSPVSKANRVPMLPLDRQLRYGTGIQYKINEDMSAGFSWEFVDAGPGPYTANRGALAGTLQGHYSTNYLNFTAVDLIWKF